MILGIDASNIRAGGGVTHLKNLLDNANPVRFGFSKIIVWGGKRTLEEITRHKWLEMIEIPELNRSLVFRLIWQNITLTSVARKSCDLLFVPGGLYIGRFRPYVTLCQNLLPFSNEEIARYGVSARTIRMNLLARGQAYTFRNSEGIIFLTKFARKILTSKVPSLKKSRHIIIPHGIDQKFYLYKEDKIEQTESIKFLYVSTVDLYKHQCNVAISIANLKKEGFNIELELIGSAYAPALKKLKTTIEKIDKNGAFIKYKGAIDYNCLPSFYHKADLFIFASTCENLPIILLEAMASQIPIACSNRQPMPEILGDAGVYFDPENITSITNALRKLLLSSELRKSISLKAKERANEFTWEQCSKDTFRFFSDCAISFYPPSSGQ